MKLADALKDRAYNGIIIYKARIEKEEKHKVNEEKHPLYSHRKGKVLSFPDKINELNEMYQDLIFDLAENSNERIRDLKQFSAEEVIIFNRKVTEKLKRQSKKM